MDEAVLTPPLPLPEIISRYRDGESLTKLAEESGVHRVTLWRWMLSDLGQAQHESMITDCLINRVGEAEAELEEVAEDVKRNPACNLARARELISIADKRMKYTRMDLERRRPHLYGPKMETKHDTTITVIVQRQTPQPIQIMQAEAQEAPNIREIMPASPTSIE